VSLPPLDLLPDDLHVRATALNERACDETADFVLHWMRTSVRGHDNPALDAAVTIANELGVPVLVYHALSERYPFASDRHHRFILEGARDVQAELAERGIAYAFHLERPGHRGDHLKALAARAGAVVTESFPWTPIRRWTRAVAEAAPVGMIGVDAACLVPMRTVPASARDRAFRFRKATADTREAVLAAEPRDVEPEHGAALPDLPFEALDLQTADLADLIACCEIDHGVGPVPHTPGGSRAGYARWAAFRDGGLRAYAAERNDPLAGGVSRLSPYLHYGHISPFRIAREADALGGKGAEKFLDELLVWREMSWAWAFRAKVHDDLEALPDWARETLADHADDPREVLHDAETLARGRTGDALWDAAQRSLLIHGELHNNVRMTWGKMIPQWTPDAATALATLIDLNHRYALDGRDPNSYGGLLWCLGGFDRPFDPPKPVLGRVRPRDTATHARRLDVDAYARLTGRPASDAPPRVAVLGAGVAGLAAARTLADHGLPVTVVDKGRRPGGRLATRTTRRDPDLAFDHGAPAFAARDARFRRVVDAWAEAGRVRIDDDVAVPVGGAAALADHLAADVEVHCGTRVTHLAHDAAGWHLHGEDGKAFGPFEALILTTPPQQAAALLEPVDPDRAAALAAVPMTPGWTVMLRAPGGQAPAALPEDGPLAAVHAEDARPGRAPREAFTIHASAAFARARLEDAPAEVAEALAPAIADALGVPVDPGDLACHRWRYAHAPEAPAGLDPWDGARGLALAGDGIATGTGVEAAWLSGIAAAGRVLGAGIEGPALDAAPPLAQDDLFAAP
jgi:photolyase PhrII